MRWDQIEGLTQRIQRDYAPQTLTTPIPFPIEELIQFDLEQWTGAVFRVEEHDSRFEGVTRYNLYDDRLELILAEKTYNALLEGDRRARMTAAHELGHVLLHSEEIVRTGGSEPLPPGFFRSHKEVPAFRNPERQAGVFAGRLLVSTQSLRAAIETVGPDVSALADMFHVSFGAMKVRMGEIGAL